MCDTCSSTSLQYSLPKSIQTLIKSLQCLIKDFIFPWGSPARMDDIQSKQVKHPSNNNSLVNSHNLMSNSKQIELCHCYLNVHRILGFQAPEKHNSLVCFSQRTGFSLLTAHVKLVANMPCKLFPMLFLY